MKFLFDFFPILLFFIAYKTFDIYVATAVAIVAGLLQVGYNWFRHKRIENSHLFTLVILLVFGGATLILHDEMFIKWKPTVLNWAFAIAFIGSQFIGDKTIAERTMGKSVALPPGVWARLNMSWALFCITLGIANLYVVYNFDTDTWVNFKIFGIVGSTVLFIIGQTFYMFRHMEPSELDN